MTCGVYYEHLKTSLRGTSAIILAFKILIVTLLLLEKMTHIQVLSITFFE